MATQSALVGACIAIGLATAACNRSDGAARAQGAGEIAAQQAAAEAARHAQVTAETARQQAAAQAEAAGEATRALAALAPPMPAGAQPAAGGPDRAITGSHFSYAVPSDWTTLPTPEMFESAARGPGPGTPAPRVQVFAEPFTGTGPEYGRRVATSTRLTETVNSEREVALGSLHGLELDLTMSLHPRRSLKRVTADGGRGYSITCSAEASEWAAALPTCARVVASFRITP